MSDWLPPGASQPKQEKKKSKSWVSGLIIFAIAFPIALGVLKFFSGPSKKEPKQLSQAEIASKARSEARFFCEHAIKTSANNPSAAKVTRPDYQENSEGWLLRWPHGQGLRLQNGFGALLDASAECQTQPDGKRVTALIINGTRILGKP